MHSKETVWPSSLQKSLGVEESLQLTAWAGRSNTGLSPPTHHRCWQAPPATSDKMQPLWPGSWEARRSPQFLPHPLPRSRGLMQECSSPANNWLPLRGPSCCLPVRNWSSLKCSECTQFLACALGDSFCSPRNSGFASAEAQRPRQVQVRRAWGRRCRMSSACASQRRPHSCGWWVTRRYRSCLHSRTCTPVTKARRQGKESERWEREERLKQRVTEGSVFRTETR